MPRRRDRAGSNGSSHDGDDDDNSINGNSSASFYEDAVHAFAGEDADPNNHVKSNAHSKDQVVVGDRAGDQAVDSSSVDNGVGKTLQQSTRDGRRQQDDGPRNRTKHGRSSITSGTGRAGFQVNDATQLEEGIKTLRFEACDVTYACSPTIIHTAVLVDLVWTYVHCTGWSLHMCTNEHFQEIASGTHAEVSVRFTPKMMLSRNSSSGV